MLRSVVVTKTVARFRNPKDGSVYHIEKGEDGEYTMINEGTASGGKGSPDRIIKYLAAMITG